MSPKSGLRHPMAVSEFAEFETGTSFQEVIDDPKVKAKDVKRLIFCTGKIYFELLKAREENKQNDIAIVRLEQLYPFPQDQINKLLKKYESASKYWVQEESANMGSWDYLMRYWRRTDIDLISRPATASPATGFKKLHEKQQADLIKRALGK